MWAQPWAWLGLAGLAVPIAIHLLARHQAVRAAFPTLRFIDASELNAIKRQRLTDMPLLLVRMLMIALAVAAIAGPRLGATAIAGDKDPAHVTVYDMTASAASGRSDSFVSMRRRAHVRTESLPAGLKAAADWAVLQPGERQITVVSDFQRGPLDDETVHELIDAWQEHKVLILPDQPIDRDQHKRFAAYFGDVFRHPFLSQVSKDPDVEFCSLVQTRRNVFVQRTNMEGLRLNGIPSEANVLGKFDVFLLGDLAST